MALLSKQHLANLVLLGLLPYLQPSFTIRQRRAHIMQQRMSSGPSFEVSFWTMNSSLIIAHSSKSILRKRFLHAPSYHWTPQVSTSPLLRPNRTPLAAETWRVRQPSIIKQVPKPSHSEASQPVGLWHTMPYCSKGWSATFNLWPLRYLTGRQDSEHIYGLDTGAGKERDGRRRRYTLRWRFVGMGYWHDGDYSSSPGQSKSLPLVPGFPSEPDDLKPGKLQTSRLHDDRSMELDPHAL